MRRVSDQERERAAERLKPRLVDGSLSTDTFSARLDLVYAARTRHELARPFADLPALRDRVRAWFRRTSDAEFELRFPRTTEPASLSIGRSDGCDFVVDDATVSRRHAVVSKVGDGWKLRDLGSTNGMQVNGWRVREAVVRSGDEVCLGCARFVVR